MKKKHGDIVFNVEYMLCVSLIHTFPEKNGNIMDGNKSRMEMESINAAVTFLSQQKQTKQNS